ncbi:NADPH-dependent FMN reductase [Nonomuraea guangzhouensis]|uniref:NADPH-dependent FMN reductase n=1 Tax=Nonomuraea guangzhouensis TaxID=1291555 RepID=A0ABW4G2H4_9ACTN|nr:NAD(P)H-dependent oxidoreductase [Nonomuraea guangzhouensis]
MTRTQTLKLAVLIGSVREGRFGPVIARWFTEQARLHDGFDIDVIDLAETPLPAALPAGLEDLVATETRPPAMAELARRVGAADAFVVVTPEYNHSFPASLKSFIDWHYTEWQAKPVAFVSYGGFGGGVRAVEHLRQVFAEVHATTIRDMVTFDNHWQRFDADGRPLDLDGVNGAAKTLLDQLAWWAAALHDARARVPYVS